MGSRHEMPAHHPGSRRGEHLRRHEGKEAGHHDTGTAGAGRQTGKATARFFTGINPDDRNPIDPESPMLVTP